MRIDVHAHYFPTEYLNLLDKLGSPLTRGARNMQAGKEPGDLEARFAMMDEAGIDLQILSVAPTVPYFQNESDAVEAARLANNLYAEIVREYPNRFKAFAITPLPHIEASLAELARGLDELEMVGVAITTTVVGKMLTDAHFDPFFAELDQRGATLFLHPAGVDLGEYTRAFGLTWMVGAPFEDTYAALHLILSGLTTRYPRIKIIVPHLGGTLPFLMNRVDSQYPVFGTGQIKEAPSTLAKRLWYDTVSHGNIPALRCACEALGASQLVLGTDYPYLRGEKFKRAVSYIRDASLAEEEVKAILENNVQNLLPDH